MFGRKKMYKKGLEDAMHAYQDFGKKQEEAIKKLREEVQSGNKKIEDMLNEIGEDINGVYDYLTDQEKATLYHLCTPKDIKELDEAERRLLVAVLYQLANDEGGWNLTDYQKKYVRSVQKYLEITNPQTEIDLSAIENIDSIDSQKVILQVVLEFMYLQDTDEISDPQEEFLGYFSLNKKQAEQIEQYVAKLYNTVGAEGICEKYGFVENVDDLLEESENSEPKVNTDIDFYYDCRIGAARRWGDNQVIFEPREQCPMQNIMWKDHILIWRGKSTGEEVSHVTDLRTLKDIATFVGDEKIPFSSVISSKYFCYYDEQKHCYIIKDYVNSFYKEYKFPSYGVSMCAIENDMLILDCFNFKDHSSYAVVYNFIENTQEVIDSFRDNYHLNHIFAVDGKLIIVAVVKGKIGEKTGYDIWCYDLKQKKYIWKQYRAFESTTEHSVYMHFENQITSYDGKAEIFGSDEVGYFKRFVFDLKDGTLLSQQVMDVGDEVYPYNYMLKIDHTIVYMFFGYKYHTDFYINTFTFDCTDEQLNTDRYLNIQQTEQGNEILKRMGI